MKRCGGKSSLHNLRKYLVFCVKRLRRTTQNIIKSCFRAEVLTRELYIRNNLRCLLGRDVDQIEFLQFSITSAKPCYAFLYFFNHYLCFLFGYIQFVNSLSAFSFPSANRADGPLSGPLTALGVHYRRFVALEMLGRVYIVYFITFLTSLLISKLFHSIPFLFFSL